MAEAYDRYGGMPVINHIAWYLMDGASEFGPGVREIDIRMALRNTRPPRRGMESRLEEFNSALAGLPKITFRKNREKVEMRFASSEMSAADWGGQRNEVYSWFRRLLPEFVDALHLLKTQVTSKDAFDVDGFFDHCARKLNDVPQTEDAFWEMADCLQEREAKRQMTLSEWDLLGIEWRDYHSDARKILDSPFFWSCTDDFAPHGNDTGADLLHDYMRWFERDRGVTDSLYFYHEHTRGWYKSGGVLPEIMRGSIDQAAIAVAFAEIKMRGACRPSVAALARAAMQRQRVEAETVDNATYLRGRLERLACLEEKLSLAVEKNGN